MHPTSGPNLKLDQDLWAPPDFDLAIWGVIPAPGQHPRASLADVQQPAPEQAGLDPGERVGGGATAGGGPCTGHSSGSPGGRVPVEGRPVGVPGGEAMLASANSAANESGCSTLTNASHGAQWCRMALGRGNTSPAIAFRKICVSSRPTIAKNGSCAGALYRRNPALT